MTTATTDIAVAAATAAGAALADLRTRCAAADCAHRLALQLAAPPALATGDRWRHQSLLQGTAGIALVHIERALTGVAAWDTAKTFMQAAISGGVTVGADAGPHHGAWSTAPSSARRCPG
jgi:hypothetical protein